MSVKEDFAFIVYCATFACYMAAYAIAWLNDDLPPRWRWFVVFWMGSMGYVTVNIL